MAPPLSAIKIEQYCGARGGGGALGTLKSYKDSGAPSLSLRLLSIVGSSLGRGGALIRGRKNPTKIVAPPLPVIKIVKYCGVWEEGMGYAKILQKIMASPLSVIKIVKYCGVRGRGGALRGAKIPQKLMKIMAPPLSVIKIVGKNVLLINNIIVYCLSLFPSVLFEK